jgi:release factor glutamine methyltransferase
VTSFHEETQKIQGVTRKSECFVNRSMTTIAETILQGANRLRRAGVPEARREAGSLVAHVLGRDRSFILSHAEDPIDAQQAERFLQTLERRADGEPLQYITGHQEFFGLDFELTKDVLIPRPETELLVETALKLLADSTNPFFCDVGTGSGCIAVTLLHELPQARAIAVDVSPMALLVAQRNAARHSVIERAKFVRSDCFAALNARDPLLSAFDLIVSNPPYIEENAIADLQREVRDFEPRLALAAGVDGLTMIRRLLVEAPSYMKTDGYFLMEIGFNQAAAVEQLLDPKIWRLMDIHKDLHGIPRTVALQKRS